MTLHDPTFLDHLPSRRWTTTTHTHTLSSRCPACLAAHTTPQHCRPPCWFLAYCPLPAPFDRHYVLPCPHPLRVVGAVHWLGHHNTLTPYHRLLRMERILLPGSLNGLPLAHSCHSSTTAPHHTLPHPTIMVVVNSCPHRWTGLPVATGLGVLPYPPPPPTPPHPQHLPLPTHPTPPPCSPPYLAPPHFTLGCLGQVGSQW